MKTIQFLIKKQVYSVCLKPNNLRKSIFFALIFHRFLHQIQCIFSIVFASKTAKNYVFLVNNLQKPFNILQINTLQRH